MKFIFENWKYLLQILVTFIIGLTTVIGIFHGFKKSRELKKTERYILDSSNLLKNCFEKIEFYINKYGETNKTWSSFYKNTIEIEQKLNTIELGIYLEKIERLKKRVDFLFNPMKVKRKTNTIISDSEFKLIKKRQNFMQNKTLYYKEYKKLKVEFTNLSEMEHAIEKKINIKNNIVEDLCMCFGSDGVNRIILKIKESEKKSHAIFDIENKIYHLNKNIEMLYDHLDLLQNREADLKFHGFNIEDIKDQIDIISPQEKEEKTTKLNNLIKDKIIEIKNAELELQITRKQACDSVFESIQLWILLVCLIKYETQNIKTNPKYYYNYFSIYSLDKNLSKKLIMTGNNSLIKEMKLKRFLRMKHLDN